MVVNMQSFKEFYAFIHKHVSASSLNCLIQIIQSDLLIDKTVYLW